MNIKTTLALLITLFSVFAKAEPFFEVFNGEYQVKSRQCATSDIACKNLSFVTIGYDQSILRSYVVEFYKDGTKNKIILEEDQETGVQNFVTGDYGTRVYWTHMDTSGGAIIAESIGIERMGTMTYSHDYEGPQGQYSQEFVLVKK